MSLSHFHYVDFKKEYYCFYESIVFFFEINTIHFENQ